MVHQLLGYLFDPEHGDFSSFNSSYTANNLRPKHIVPFPCERNGEQKGTNIADIYLEKRSHCHQPYPVCTKVGTIEIQAQFILCMKNRP